ncbi:hypothetical protein [Streptomyces lydicus]|uniref:hypothetical protein n=1 Tax=Streptomyces lydicus TaxID=47763 RepID=UPI00371D8EC8
MADSIGLHVSPEFPAMLERIDALGGVLEADADAAEKLGRLTEDVARALLGAGVVGPHCRRASAATSSPHAN